MIDNPEKTDLLMAMLKMSLPVRANVTQHLAKAMAAKSPKISMPAQCNVIDIFYTGDASGILCHLDIGPPDSKTPLIVSITHLTFNRNIPSAREIGAYQKHRIKKLKRQQSHNY